MKKKFAHHNTLTMRKKKIITPHISPNLSKIFVVHSQNFDRKKQKKTRRREKMNRVMGYEL
ncbi:MAG: hypothetical protein LBG80_09950 [Bacteroidales bacterium]|jgi:hypothetical protein|nr:hypothetical protein [Bacteroidales bacterium]